MKDHLRSSLKSKKDLVDVGEKKWRRKGGGIFRKRSYWSGPGCVLIGHKTNIIVRTVDL